MRGAWEWRTAWQINCWYRISHHGRPRLTAVAHCRTRLTRFNAWERRDGLIALLDFSSVLFDDQTSLTTFERQVHLRLHSSAPSQRICGWRPGSACIWVWLHTDWTTTLVRPTTNAWQSRLAPGSHNAEFIWHNSATVIWKGLGRKTPTIELYVYERGVWF